MAVEVYANRAQDTLDGGIDDNDLSLVLDDASEFPATGNFRILIDSEILICTARSSNTLTVLRGQEGTVAASHSSGATVTLVVTAASLKQVRATGRGRIDFVPLVDSGFTWVNQGSATITDANGLIYLSLPTRAANQGSFRFQTIPATPYVWTVYTDVLAAGNTDNHVGIALRDSVGGRIITLEYQGASNNWSIKIIRWDSATSRNTAAKTVSVAQFYPWMRISDDGTTRKYFISSDGDNFIEIFSELHTDWMTPDQYGFGGNCNSTEMSLGYTVYHWKTE